MAAVQQTHDDNDSQSPPPSDRDLEKSSDAGTPENTNKESNSSTPAAPGEQPPPKDPNLVDWDGPDDPASPLNWPRRKRWIMTVILATNTWMVAFASSISASAVPAQSKEFGVSNVVMTLSTTLFIVGWGFGPLIWGPGSEAFGRKRPLYFGFGVFTIMQIPVAVAQNVETIMLARFLGGVFGSAPLAIVGGIFADIWTPVDRGIALSIFSTTTFMGPIFGPIIGSFVTQSHLGWRWTGWVTLIGAAVALVIGVVFVPETSHGYLLQLKAEKMRHETKNWAYHAKADEQPLNYRTVFTVYLARPFQMIFSEPILLLITVYVSYIYGILYLFFEAYPISFQEDRGWSAGLASLPFLGLLIGVLIGSSFFLYNTRTRFVRKCKEAGRLIPEERLVPMMVGSIVLPIGLFWFAWTSNPHINPAPQIIAGIPIGCGLFLIFMPGTVYLVDVYLMFAASAVSANTFLRSMTGGAFPLFAAAMYHNLGINWASSLLAFLSLAMMPAPFLFYLYGHKLRAISKMAPNMVLKM